MASIYGGLMAPKVFGNPQGQAQQNQLYRSLSSAAVQPAAARPAGVPGLGDSPYDPNQEFFPAHGVGGNMNTPYTPSPAQQASYDNSQSDTNNNNTGNGPNLDFSGDPILAQIRAMNAMNIANAEASALAGRKRAEIGYGYDPNLQYEDPATQEAARQNPFSTLAQLLQIHQQRETNLTEGENKANLFYSGDRINKTGIEGRQTLQEQANAQGSFQNVIDQIAQSVLNAKMNAQQAELGGEQAAYDRAIQFALANNTGYPGSSGGGGGGGYNTSDFQYGAHLPSGHTLDQVHQAAVAGAPHGAVPMHIMDQGMVFPGNIIHIKYRMPDGTTSTEPVHLP